jgi:ribosomal protein S27E
MAQRSSDLVETYVARALGVGALAVVFLALATVMYVYRGDSGLALAIVLAVIGVSCLAYALYSFVKSRGVTSFSVKCPMCGANNGFLEQPMSDVTCQECHRMIPIENGMILPLKQVSCGSCGESNWYSDRTKVLLCEACGREIAIARAGSETTWDGRPAYAVQDDSRPYEVVLLAFGAETDELVDHLQHTLGRNRVQIKELLSQLPAVVVTNVPRQKAEILRNELSHRGAAVEARPLS